MPKFPQLHETLHNANLHTTHTTTHNNTNNEENIASTSDSNNKLQRTETRIQFLRAIYVICIYNCYGYIFSFVLHLLNCNYPDNLLLRTIYMYTSYAGLYPCMTYMIVFFLNRCPTPNYVRTTETLSKYREWISETFCKCCHLTPRWCSCVLLTRKLERFWFLTFPVFNCIFIWSFHQFSIEKSNASPVWTVGCCM